MFKNLDKVSIIGIITCLVAMVLLFMRMSDRSAQLRMQQEQQRALMETDAKAVAGASSVVPASSVAPVASPKAPVANASAPASAPVVSSAADASLPVGASAWKKSSGKVVELVRENEAIYRIDPLVGVVAVEMMNYERQPVGKEDPGKVVLGHYDYPFLTLTSWEGPLNWQPVADGGVVVDEAGKRVSVTRLTADGKVRVRETWSLAADARYEVTYGVTFENVSSEAVDISGLALEIGALSPMMAGPGELGYGGVSYMLPPVTENHSILIAEGDLRDAERARAVIADPNSTSLQREDARGDLQIVKDVAWACVNTRYFMQGVRSSDPKFTFASLEAFSCENMPEVEASEKNKRFRGRLELPKMILAAGATESLEFTGIVGPMNLNMLREKQIGLEGILGIDRFFWGSPGWMGSLSRFFVNALVWLSKLFPGDWALGFALILLTVIVKCVLWPLSYRSSKSMKKMQELQPQLKELREKYKSDPQEMYRRQQELFKENKVSQFGGCLPMLVQIPIFFALFNTFRGSIELRQASFLWASDLSLPDTIADLGFIGLNPMALIMVATMLWQQAITPSGDPQQKRMMMMMSVAFTYFLYTQPSGLTLYMTVNQLLSMLQFYLLKKMDAKSSNDAGGASGGKAVAKAGVK